MDGIWTGSTRIQPLARFGTVTTVAAWNGCDGEVPADLEEAFDLADVMNEL